MAVSSFAGPSQEAIRVAEMKSALEAKLPELINYPFMLLRMPRYVQKLVNQEIPSRRLGKRKEIWWSSLKMFGAQC